MVKLTGSEVVLVALSVTAIPGLKAPAAVGVPETTPAELSERPAGRLEFMPRAQVYGGTPPVAASWKLYAVPTVPVGAVVVVICNVPPLMAMERFVEVD